LRRRRRTAIAVDAAGHAHVAYLDTTRQALEYATNASGAWTHFVIDYVGDSASNSNHSIAVDSAGAVHISYRRGSLRYATNH